MDRPAIGPKSNGTENAFNYDSSPGQCLGALAGSRKNRGRIMVLAMTLIVVPGSFSAPATVGAETTGTRRSHEPPDAAFHPRTTRSRSSAVRRRAGRYGADRRTARTTARSQPRSDQRRPKRTFGDVTPHHVRRAGRSGILLRRNADRLDPL